MKSGIYYIKNTITNQYYVGSSFDIKKRWRDHKWHLRHSKHHNQYLQNSWNKYGEEAFEFAVILECVDDILEQERQLFVEYKSRIEEGGFNVNDPEHVFLGKKHSDETKKKLSQQKLGAKNPRYGKVGVNAGKIMSQEFRDLVSSKRKGIAVHRGTDTISAKLNEDNVREIRSKYVPRKYSARMLAKEYNVAYSTIINIVNRINWKHVV